SAVVGENRSSRADLGHAGGGIHVGSEMIVKTPGADRFPHDESFGSVPGIGNLHHHTVERGQVLYDDAPIAVFATGAHDGAKSIHQRGRWPQDRSMPDTLALDFRIKRESGRGLVR